MKKLALLLVALLLTGCVSGKGNTTRKVKNQYDNCHFHFDMKECLYVITYDKRNEISLSVDDVHRAGRWSYDITNTLYEFDNKTYEFIIFEGLLTV